MELPNVGLMDAGGVACQAWFDLSLTETFNPTQTTWQSGDIIHTSWQLDLLAETPPGNYTFDLVLPAAAITGANNKLSFGSFTLGSPKFLVS